MLVINLSTGICVCALIAGVHVAISIFFYFIFFFLSRLLPSSIPINTVYQVEQFVNFHQCAHFYGMTKENVFANLLSILIALIYMPRSVIYSTYKFSRRCIDRVISMNSCLRFGTGSCASLDHFEHY